MNVIFEENTNEIRLSFFADAHTSKTAQKGCIVYVFVELH